MRSKDWIVVEPGGTENILPGFFCGLSFSILLLPACKVAADTVALNPKKVEVRLQE